MGEALYRKKRPKKLDEVVGQEHVTSTLKNALKTGRISHAYLLTGPKGVGKTSIARILAFEVNNLPYSTNQHLDIIEIDAASNRRIDEVRDIREKVRIAPTSAKYKVYIIDEVHMLTKEAFNALLKTLEEPPEHVIFILATTEAHKLPDTIISRTQRYNLKPITQNVIASQLQDIAKSETIKISPDAVQLVARHSQGGLRDAISMLDQLSSKSSDITVEDVEHMLGVAPETAIDQLAQLINSGNPKALIEQLNNLEQQGVHAPQIAHQLSDYLHQKLIASQVDSTDTLKLLATLIDVSTAAQPFKLLELILLDYLFAHSTSRQPIEAPKPDTKLQVEPELTKNELTDSAELVSEEKWQDILKAIKQRHNTLYGIVRMAKPSMDERKLILSFKFPFHQKRMDEPKNRQLIQDIIMQTTGQQLEVVCVIDSNSVIEPESKQAKPDSATLETITDIFGGGEILES